MWRTYRAANRPWPKLSDDPVIDYMVMEAVFIKSLEEDRAAEKEQRKKAWAKDKSKLDKFR